MRVGQEGELGRPASSRDEPEHLVADGGVAHALADLVDHPGCLAPGLLR